jgi:hypothetical protein
MAKYITYRYEQKCTYLESILIPEPLLVLFLHTKAKHYCNIIHNRYYNA